MEEASELRRAALEERTVMEEGIQQAQAALGEMEAALRKLQEDKDGS